MRLSCILNELFDSKKNYSQQDMMDILKEKLDDGKISIKEYSELITAVRIRFLAEEEMKKSYMGLIEE